jgi:hypothetical protein
MKEKEQVRNNLTVGQWTIIFFFTTLFLTLFLIAFCENKGWCLDFS